MKNDFEKDVTVTTKGQLTLPVGVRKLLNLGSRRKVRISVDQDGTVTMKPLPDVMSFFGILKSKHPYDPKEKSKARDAMGKHVARKGR